MPLAILTGIAAILLVCLISAEKTGRGGRILIFKAPLSLLYIYAWAVQPYQSALVSALVLTALICCFTGDILLAFSSDRPFLIGLLAFLSGHVIFAGAFFISGVTSPGMGAGVILVCVAATLVWRWLAPHLGDMTIPALAYLVVISIMVCGSWSVFINGHLPARARLGILTGALCFYLSDITVARQRFVISDHRNRMVGLPLYFGAQFILAFSAAWIPG